MLLHHSLHCCATCMHVWSYLYWATVCCRCNKCVAATGCRVLVHVVFALLHVQLLCCSTEQCAAALAVLLSACSHHQSAAPCIQLPPCWVTCSQAQQG
jgi:hypothetical protein